MGKSVQTFKSPVELIQVPRTDAHTLASLIKDCLLCLAVPISQCCGQAYDGAANICGMATLIQEAEESAICPLFNSLHKSACSRTFSLGAYKCDLCTAYTSPVLKQSLSQSCNFRSSGSSANGTIVW